MTGAIKLGLVASVPSGNFIMDITSQTGQRSARDRGPGKDSRSLTALCTQHLRLSLDRLWTGLPRPCGYTSRCSCHATLPCHAPTAGATPRFMELRHGAAGRQRQGGKGSSSLLPARYPSSPGRAWAWPAARAGEPGRIGHGGDTVVKFSHA